MKEKKVVILITAIISVLAIAIAITSVFLLSPSASYTRSIQEAENLVEEGDYENAVLAYQEAIEKDPDNVDAYLGLAEIYEMNGDLLLAIDVLEDGYVRTKSAQIRVMLNHLLEADETVIEVDGVSLNRTLLSMFSTYREEDYEERYGRSDGRREARFDGLDAKITFDEAGVPEVIAVDDVLTLFKADEAFDASLLEDMRLERLRMRNDSEHGEMVVFLYEDMKISIALEDGMITSSSYNELIPSLDEIDEEKDEENEEDEDEEEKETILCTGVTTDYLTGEVIGNVSMTVYRGHNNSGQKYLELSSNDNGEFQMNLECGRYFYVEFKKDAYTSEWPLRVAKDGTIYEGLTVPLTQPLDDIFIILEWESEEVELISELVALNLGEDGSTKDTGEITGVGGETVAYREITDTGSVVRDVTTIVDEADRYAFYVHRIEGDGTFGEAKAKVTIQVPGISDVVVEVKQEIIGDYWLVGVIDHGKFFIRNDGVEGYSMF